MNVMTPTQIRDEAMCAFITTIAGLRTSSPTWCAGWAAQNLIPHVPQPTPSAPS